MGPVTEGRVISLLEAVREREKAKEGQEEKGNGYLG